MNLLAHVLAAMLGVLSTSARGPAPLPNETYTLENGLTVVLHHDQTAPVVAVRVLYRVGMSNDPPGKQGMVHLMEHALFHRSEHLEGSVRRELSRIAATHINGVTTPDFMQLREIVPAPNLASALRLEADRMGFHEFDAQNLDAEKTIVNREVVERAQRDAWGRVSRVARTKLYGPSQPLQPSSPETLASISVSDVEALAATSLNPDNAVLALAGDLPSNTRELVEHYFADLEPGTSLPTEPIRRPALVDEVRISVDGGPETPPRVLVVWRAPRAGHADEPSATLAAAVVQRRLQKLHSDVWAHDADAYGGTSQYLRGNTYGEFSVGAVVRKGASPSGVVEALDDVLVRMLEDPPTDRELNAARKWISVAILRQLDSLEMRAEVLAESAAVGKVDIVASGLSALERVTSDDVSRFVRVHLVGQTGRVVVLQSPGGGA